MYQALDVAEGLLQLDPVRTYPQRGAALVAQLAKVRAFRLEVEDGDDIVGTSQGGAPEDDLTAAAPALSVSLRTGRLGLGTLHLYGDGDGRLAPHELRLARWGARLLSRGMAYARRLAVEGRRRGGEQVSDALARAPLTPREKDVVALLVGGSSTREIARKTTLTVATVNTYLKRIFSKLGVHSRVELVARMAGTHGGGGDADDDLREASQGDEAPPGNRRDGVEVGAAGHHASF